MRRWWLAILACAIASAGPAPAQRAQPSEGSAQRHATPASSTFARLVAEFDDYVRSQDPIGAGFEGDRAALSRLPDPTPQAAASRRDSLQRFRSRFDAVRSSDLTEDERVNLAVARRLVDEQLQSLAFDEDRWAINNDSGFHTLLSYLASSTVVRSEADAEAWLARLEAAPAWYAANNDNLRRGVRTRWTQPRSVTEGVLSVARAQAELAPADDPMLRPLADAAAPSIPAARRAALRARAQAVIAERIRPAQRDFVLFLEREYLPAARPQLGVSGLPGGREYYTWLARRHTTTALNPDQIHALGQQEVARIRAQMDVVMRDAGFQGSFPEFLQFLRTDPQFYATSREEMLRIGSEIAKRADDRLPRLFRTLPRLPYGVRPVPQEIEDGYTTGRYNPGSPQNGVAGGLMLNTGNLGARPLYELPALVLHEGAPGHHIQIALAQEAAEQPYFRRTAEVTAFTEGWGLYAEFLGEEMGIYRTPYERFGRLSYEMWRACRLVADTGIHWMGWSLEQARACFRDNSALAPHNIETELQRYVSWPGQALGYKVGELRLKALRARAEQALGSRFDVRDFHDQLLVQGALPLDLLEQRVDRWIARVRSEAPPL